MTAATPVRLLSDPDRHIVYPITDADGENLNWATPTVTTRGRVAGVPTDITLTATWLGVAAPTRNIDVSLSGITEAGMYTLVLVVPGDNDVRLGSVSIR